MEVSQKITPEFVQQKYIELIEDSNVFLQKKTHPFSFKNIGIYTGLVGLLTLIIFGFYFYNNIEASNQSIFEGHLKAVSFDENAVLIETADGAFYKVDETTHQKWLTGSKMFVEVNPGKIGFNLLSTNKESVAQIYKIWVPSNKKFQVELVDGTKIQLNSNTQLQFTNKRISPQENAVLYGEAFFEVAHNPNHPYLIKANNIEVAVYGTTFNISNYQENSFTSVALVEGSVKVITNAEEHYIKPGQKAVLQKHDNSFDIQQADFSEILVWRTDQMHFEKEDLLSITHKIAKWYDLAFIINEKDLQKMKFTGSFSKEDGIIHFLQMLNYTAGVKYEINDKDIILSK